jgi:hypothetical protein
MSNMAKSGWQREPARHALAAKGIKTKAQLKSAMISNRRLAPRKTESLSDAQDGYEIQHNHVNIRVMPKGNKTEIFVTNAFDSEGSIDHVVVVDTPYEDISTGQIYSAAKKLYMSVLGMWESGEYAKIDKTQSGNIGFYLQRESESKYGAKYSDVAPFWIKMMKEGILDFDQAPRKVYRFRLSELRKKWEEVWKTTPEESYDLRYTTDWQNEDWFDIEEG